LRLVGAKLAALLGTVSHLTTRGFHFTTRRSPTKIHAMAVTVRAASLSNYLEVAAQVGLDAHAMLRRIGIDPRVLAEPDARIQAFDVARLLELSAAASGCPTFGLRMAESRRISDFGAISLLISHQATVRDALMTIVHYRMLLNESLMVQVEEHGGLVLVREELHVGGETPLRQAYELAVGVIYRMFRALLGSRWRAHSVNFAHAAPPDLAVHRRIFGPITEFGSDFNGMTCSRADLDTPNPSADPSLAQYAERYVQSLPLADRRSFSQDVLKAIYLLLPGEGASIITVSEILGMNPRTLQRRLAGEGGEFGRLLNEARRDLAMRYLENRSVPLSRVAGLLGYTRQSSFSRWFGEAFGMSPSAWRQRPAAVPPAADPS
jgi:AraC-like DNA-binding protein